MNWAVELVTQGLFDLRFIALSATSDSTKQVSVSNFYSNLTVWLNLLKLVLG